MGEPMHNWGFQILKDSAMSLRGSLEIYPCEAVEKGAHEPPPACQCRVCSALRTADTLVEQLEELRQAENPRPERCAGCGAPQTEITWGDKGWTCHACGNIHMG